MSTLFSAHLNPRSAQAVFLVTDQVPGMAGDAPRRRYSPGNIQRGGGKARGELSIVKGAAPAGDLFIRFEPWRRTSGVNHDAFALR